MTRDDLNPEEVVHTTWEFTWTIKQTFYLMNIKCSDGALRDALEKLW